MDHSLPLKAVDHGKIESLRERMDDAGCVFEFVIVAPDSDAVIDGSMHRRAWPTQCPDTSLTGCGGYGTVSKVAAHTPLKL